MTDYDRAAERVSTALRRLHYQLAAARVIAVAGRLVELLGKANFNPDQPRVPRGNPDGGQWAAVGGAVSGNAPSLFDQTDPELWLLESIPAARVLLVGDEGTPLGDPPEIPQERPTVAVTRNAIIKNVAKWLKSLSRASGQPLYSSTTQSRHGSATTSMRSKPILMSPRQWRSCTGRSVSRRGDITFIISSSRRRLSRMGSPDLGSTRQRIWFASRHSFIARSPHGIIPRWRSTAGNPLANTFEERAGKNEKALASRRSSTSEFSSHEAPKGPRLECRSAR
jgi:hypothetical protein